jgi:hypothetical protein
MYNVGGQCTAAIACAKQPTVRNLALCTAATACATQPTVCNLALIPIVNSDYFLAARNVWSL